MKRYHGSYVISFVICGAVCLILASAFPVEAVLYQYVDEDGVVHVSTTPPEVVVKGTAESLDETEIIDIVPETELEVKFKRFKEYLIRYEVISIVTHERKAEFATILDTKNNVMDTFVPGMRIGEAIVDYIRPTFLMLSFEDYPFRVTIRLKWGNPTIGPNIVDFQAKEEKTALEELADSIKPDFHIEDVRAGTMTAEVEAPSEAGSGGRITWTLGSYTGVQIENPTMLKMRKSLPEAVLGLLQTSYERSGLTFPPETGVTVELAGEDSYDFSDKLVAVELEGLGRARLVLNADKSMDETAHPANRLRNEMIKLMLSWNQILGKQPAWLRELVLNTALDTDQKNQVADAVAAISIDDEIWSKNFELIIRAFDRIGTEDKFELCDVVETIFLRTFIQAKGGYEGVRTVVEFIEDGKTYLEALAAMAGERRWEAFYSEFRDFSYRELLKMPEENSRVLFLVGQTLLENGDLEGARLKLQQSVRLDPNRAEAQYLLGLSYLKLRLFDRAQRHVQRALEIDGGNPRYSATFKEISDRMGGE